MINHVFINYKYELLYILQDKFYNCFIRNIYTYLGYLNKLNNVYILNHVHNNEQLQIERKTSIILNYIEKNLQKELNLNLGISYFDRLSNREYDIIDYDIFIYDNDNNFKNILIYFYNNFIFNINLILPLQNYYNIIEINIQLIFHKFILSIIAAIDCNNLSLFKYFINVLNYISLKTTISCIISIFSWVLASNNLDMLAFLIDKDYLSNKLITNEYYINLNITKNNTNLYINIKPTILKLINNNYKIYKIKYKYEKKIKLKSNIISILKKYYNSIFGEIKPILKNIKKYNSRIKLEKKLLFLKNKKESIQCSIFCAIFNNYPDLIDKMITLIEIQYKSKNIKRKRGYCHLEIYLRKHLTTKKLKKIKLFYNPKICEFSNEYAILFNKFQNILSNKFIYSKRLINLDKKIKILKSQLFEINNLKHLIIKYNQLDVLKILIFNEK